MKHAFLIFVLITASLLAEKKTNQEQYFSSPRSTAAGILFSDQLTNGLFLVSNSGTSVISNMPGSGLFYSVSSDGKMVGFKEVLEDGSQLPVLIDLIKNERTLLHKAASRIGQVSFADNGTIAYTVENDLFIISNGIEKKIPLGSYVNLAPISPNGKNVVFNDQADQLWMMDLTTLEKRKVTVDKGSFAFPQWSPDSKHVLYSRLNGTLFVYSLSDQTNTMLDDGDSPSWIDNATIVYSYKTVDHQKLISAELYSIRSNGTEKKQLTFSTEADEIDPSYDVRSNSIIYTDIKRGGIFSRPLSAESILSNEHQILPYDNSPFHKMLLMKTVGSASPTTVTAAYFEMPYVHQVWDTPDWYNGHSACGATSSIMVIAYYNIVPKWNVWCSASGSSPGHYSPYGNYVCEKYTYREIPYSYTASDPNGKTSYGGYGFMWTGSYSPYSRTVEYYTNHGMSATRYDSNATFFETIISDVTAGYPFTLCNGLTTAGHIIVVNGYDVNNRTIIVNDPYGNKNTGTYPSLNGKGVKYDWVGYNNGYKNLNRIYWGVSVRSTAQAQADSLVDDAQLDKGFYLHTASPSSLTQWFDKKIGGYGNGHFWWTRTKLSDTCYAVWTPTLASDGLYDVSAYIPYSEAIKARYSVVTNDTTYQIVIDQKKIKNDWVSLGIFPFKKGKNGYVRLGDGSDTTKQGIIFDAMRWTSPNTQPTVVSSDRMIPNKFTLEQNYPNPFNPSTIIDYQLPRTAFVSLKMFDLLGKEVAVLVNQEQEPGHHQYRLSTAIVPLSSGVYFYTLRAGEFSDTKRLILLK